jgi:nucleoside phosphorylase
MESFGIAREVYKSRCSIHYNLQYLVIRGISDLTNTERDNQEERRLWKDYASMAAAAFARILSNAILETPHAGGLDGPDPAP